MMVDKEVQSISSKSGEMQNSPDPSAFSCLTQNCYEPFTHCNQEEAVSLQNSLDICSCCFMQVTMESSIGSARPSMLVTGFENYIKVSLYRQNSPRQLHTAIPVQETDPTAAGVIVICHTEVHVHR